MRHWKRRFQTERRKNFYTTFRLLYTDQHRLCIRESSMVSGIFIESKNEGESTLESRGCLTKRQPFSLKYPQDKTCFFLSSREIYNLLHDLSR